MSFEYEFYSVSKIKDFFKNNHANPRKKWGQNFLVDPNILNFISESIPKEKLATVNTVAEIGAGLGALTYKLIQLNKNLVLFEIDPVLIENLKQKNLPLKMIEGDVLENLQSLENEKLILVGNLPYYISTDIILLALKKLPHLQFGIFMLQKEFAARLCKEISSLSIFSLAFGEFKYLKTISENCFFPKPEATSALVSFIPNEIKFDESKILKFEKFTKSIFWGKRKTISKSISESPFTDPVEKENTIHFLKEINFPITKRPEELDKKIYKELLEKI